MWLHCAQQCSGEVLVVTENKTAPDNTDDLVEGGIDVERWVLGARFYVRHLQHCNGKLTSGEHR